VPRLEVNFKFDNVKEGDNIHPDPIIETLPIASDSEDFSIDNDSDVGTREESKTI
jgi:hypothetical protein